MTVSTVNTLPIDSLKEIKKEELELGVALSLAATLCKEGEVVVKAASQTEVSPKDKEALTKASLTLTQIMSLLGQANMQLQVTQSHLNVIEGQAREDAAKKIVQQLDQALEELKEAMEELAKFKKIQKYLGFFMDLISHVMKILAVVQAVVSNAKAAAAMFGAEILSNELLKVLNIAGVKGVSGDSWEKMAEDEIVKGLHAAGIPSPYANLLASIGVVVAVYYATGGAGEGAACNLIALQAGSEAWNNTDGNQDVADIIMLAVQQISDASGNHMSDQDRDFYSHAVVAPMVGLAVQIYTMVRSTQYVAETGAGWQGMVMKGTTYANAGLGVAQTGLSITNGVYELKATKVQVAATKEEGTIAESEIVMQGLNAIFDQITQQGNQALEDFNQRLASLGTLANVIQTAINQVR